MTSWIMIASLCAQSCAIAQSSWPDEHSCANAAVVWRDAQHARADVVCVPREYKDVKR